MNAHLRQMATVSVTIVYSFYLIFHFIFVNYYKRIAADNYRIFPAKLPILYFPWDRHRREVPTDNINPEPQPVNTGVQCLTNDIGIKQKKQKCTYRKEPFTAQLNI